MLQLTNKRNWTSNYPESVKLSGNDPSYEEGNEENVAQKMK